MTTYRISELADRAGLRPSTLRFYEQAGLLPAARSGSGYRQYGQDAVERLGFIASGKRLGLPLEEIRELLPVWADGACADVQDRLRPLLATHLAEAERRAAELDAFTDRLRRALADVDRPPKPGRCDADCWPPASPGLPVASEPPIACTLTADDRAERVERWRRLLANEIGREPIDGGLRIHLPVELAAEIGELAAAEQRCCAFFDFTVRIRTGRLTLDARAPEEAAPLLAEVFGSREG